MEHAVKTWQGQLRTIRQYVESRLGKRIEPGSALFSWLIPFCADILNKFRVGGDGRTACERITSHACKGAQFGYAEVVDLNLRRTRMIYIKRTVNSARVCSWVTHGDLQSISLLLKELCTSAERFVGVLTMLLSAWR